MRIGMLGLEDDSRAFSRRLGPEVEPEQDTSAHYANLARLGLLSFMLLAAIIGGYLNSRSNRPSNVIKRSIEKSLEHSFHASLEGSASLKDSTLSIYRNHQRYKPDTGIAIIPDIRSNEQAPFDALSALEFLHLSNNGVEYDREDMYGHGTRRFSGSFDLPGDNVSVVHVFEYWLDIRTLLAVRLNIASVERNAGTNSKGEPVSKETYVVIRYHEWK